MAPWPTRIRFAKRKRQLQSDDVPHFPIRHVAAAFAATGTLPVAGLRRLLRQRRCGAPG
jgi:hypothetical protein